MSAYFKKIRSLVGHELILCPGVTAVVVRDQDGERQVLLVQRSDNAEWTPISGALEPDEDPDAGAAREVLEETCVSVAVERVLWIQTLPQSTYPNGDRVQYYDTPVGRGEPDRVRQGAARPPSRGTRGCSRPRRCSVNSSEMTVRSARWRTRGLARQRRG